MGWQTGTLGPHLLSFHHFLNLHSWLLYHNEFFFQLMFLGRRALDKGEAGGYTQPSCTSGRGSNTFRALHPNNMLPSHSWSCFCCWTLGIIRVASEENHGDFSVFWAAPLKFLLLWELVIPPSAHREPVPEASPYHHPFSMATAGRAGKWHATQSACPPWKFLIETKTALLSLGRFPDRGDIKPQNLASILRINK